MRHNLRHLITNAHMRLRGALEHMRLSREAIEADDKEMYYLSAQEMFAAAKRIARTARSRG